MKKPKSKSTVVKKKAKTSSKKVDKSVVKVDNFDPSQAISSEFGIFGLPITEKEAQVVLLPVPWEVTTSYGVGASLGPQIIREASEQIDLFDLEVGSAYKAGYFMREYPKALKKKNDQYKKVAQALIKAKSQMKKNYAEQEKWENQVNTACEEMTEWVYRQSKEILDSGKILGLVGGDHSTPLGAIKAISEKYKQEFGILHIDAHADLRVAYQGFNQSHASIMYNVMSSDFKPQQLVQVGIRDFSEEEYNYSSDEKNNIDTFFDLEIKNRLIYGESFAVIASEVIAQLPENVYVSFDIDGLDPALCPGTGTPVAGGLSLSEVFFLFKEIQNQNKKIIGFDVNEVSPGMAANSEWDGNVGARVLFKLCGWAVRSNDENFGKIQSITVETAAGDNDIIM